MESLVPAFLFFCQALFFYVFFVGVMLPAKLLDWILGTEIYPRLIRAVKLVAGL